jgi:hypothetical protein
MNYQEMSVTYRNWNNEEIEFILNYEWIEQWDGGNDEPSYDGYIDEYEIYLEIEGKRVDFSEMLSDDVINSILQSAEYDIRNEL